MKVTLNSLVTWAIAVCAFASLAFFYSAKGLQAPASSGSAKDAAHSIARKEKITGVKNFGEVNTNLFRGAQPTPEGFAQLTKMGVQIVVDLRAERAKERDEVTRLGMQYVSIPWECYHPSDASVAEFLALIRSHPDKKIFVHCHLGTDRTGMMIAAYRMTQQGWSAGEARREMEAFGFSFEHTMVCPGLASYEKNFPHEFATSPAFQSLRSASQASSIARR
jgi:tyrosine-protein phosphatase SIW14